MLGPGPSIRHVQGHDSGRPAHLRVAKRDDPSGGSGSGATDPEGSPALPNTGQLLRANRHGTFSVVADHLNQPTSLELIRDTAYVVTLGGEVWKITSV
jgi:hypothetical protein